AGTMMIPHFAHYKTSQCDIKKRGEGEEHYKGKLLLYEWLKSQQKDVKLEAYIREIKQRRDLLLTVKNKKIAIDVPCATIDTSIYFQSNKLYRRPNIIPICILGANLFSTRSSYHFQTSHFITSFIHRFSHHYPTTLFFFCPQSEQLSLVQDIIPTNSHRAIAKQTFIPLNKATFYHLFLKQFFTEKELYYLCREKLRSFRLNNRHNFGKEQEWSNWLYEQ